MTNKGKEYIFVLSAIARGQSWQRSPVFRHFSGGFEACVKTTWRPARVHQWFLQKTQTETQSMNKVLKRLTAMKFTRKKAAVVQNPKKVVMTSWIIALKELHFGHVFIHRRMILAKSTLLFVIPECEICPLQNQVHWSISACSLHKKFWTRLLQKHADMQNNKWEVNKISEGEAGSQAGTLAISVFLLWRSIWV